MKIDEAKAKGYTEVYFTFDCVGDTILLISALMVLYQQTKKKSLIATSYKELTLNCKHIDVLDDFCESNMDAYRYLKLVDAGITPIFITATDFKNEDGLYQPLWGKKHIFINVCSKVGINSLVNVAPKLILNKKERNRGRFYVESQIAIVSTGNQQYKSIPVEVAQSIVNHLKNRYNFVQVGNTSDPLLDNVLDKREWNGLRGTASILFNSDLFVGGIGGLMHMSRAVNCRAVIAYSLAEPLYWCDYACNINITCSPLKCNKCGNNESFPYLTHCEHDYACIKEIKSDCLEEAINTQMKKKGMPLEEIYQQSNSNKASGIEDYIKRFGKLQ